MLSEGYQFYINFVDVASNFNWVFMMKSNLEVTGIFKKLKKGAELQCDHRIKSVQIDNALE